MHLYSKKKTSYLTLYNKIVSLTRKNFFYYDIKLVDSFETRIYLIFFHISFIFIILNIKKFDKNISQKIFDYFFSEIENNLRELGYGDTKINNEMKKLVKSFYGILIICKKTKEKSDSFDKNVLSNYFSMDSNNEINDVKLLNYFNKFASFVEDIPFKSLVKGVFTFHYEDK